MTFPHHSPQRPGGPAARPRGCATPSAVRGFDTVRHGERQSPLRRRAGPWTQSRTAPLFRRAIECLAPLMAAVFSAAPAPAEVQAAQAVHTQPVPHAESGAGRFDRNQWNLTETEWDRYQTLMRGIRGSVSPPTLSPIEVLGIHARDDKERTDYARRFARAMRDDVQRVVAFQGAFDRAMAELNPAANPTPNQAANPAPVQPGDRLLLFVRLADCPACESRLDEALALNRVAGRLDLYAVGGPTDEAIRAWAGARHIDPEAVRARRVTLNRDNGELGHVAGMAGTVPLLVRLRNNAATVIPTGTTP